MNLNLRPMSEAPTNHMMLVKWSDGDFMTLRLTGPYRGDAVGFYLLADVLTAVELLRQMTPEGYVYARCGHVDRAPLYADRVVYFRKLPEPVEYEYVAEEADRVPREGDYVRDRGAWLTYQDWLKYAIRPYKMDQDKTVALCARRVEVKR